MQNFKTATFGWIAPCGVYSLVVSFHSADVLENKD